MIALACTQISNCYFFVRLQERVGIRHTRRLRWLRRDAMGYRKLQEYSLANTLLVFSEFHRKSFISAGFPENRLFLCPLWVEFHFWRQAKTNAPNDQPDAPLKLLFVGDVSLRKGIPFLIKAVGACGKAVRLTIVGPLTSSRNELFLANTPANVRYLPPQSKTDLRKTYATHDVLILPSVAELFGRVALEAMAAGLPVILTENCGAPVPDPSWRVPAMDPESLAKRIMEYVDDRTLVLKDGEQAARFAVKFTALAYRQRIQALFKNVLDTGKF